LRLPMRTATTGLVCDFVFMTQIIRFSLPGFDTVRGLSFQQPVPGQSWEGLPRRIRTKQCTSGSTSSCMKMYTLRIDSSHEENPALTPGFCICLCAEGAFRRARSTQMRMGMRMYRYLTSSLPSSGRIWPADWASLNSRRTSPEFPMALRKSMRYWLLKPTTSGS